ncbi:MAG TPA: hypothetical protein VI959_03395 [Alphaproteobacteria bacterium]|nr:hypothetical protein [Alphaproteobacteria bacterium]
MTKYTFYKLYFLVGFSTFSFSSDNLSIPDQKSQMSRSFGKLEQVTVNNASLYLERETTTKVYNKLKDSLCFLKTSHEIFQESLNKNPSYVDALITVLSVSNINSEINFGFKVMPYGTFPLTIINSPLARASERSRFSVEFSYWGDFFSYFLNTFFQNGFSSQLTYDDAYKIKRLIKVSMGLLKERKKKADDLQAGLNRTNECYTSNLNDDQKEQFDFFQKTNNSYSGVLFECVETINNLLPNFHSNIEDKNIEAILIKNTEKRMMLDRELIEIEEGLDILYKRYLKVKDYFAQIRNLCIGDYYCKQTAEGKKTLFRFTAFKNSFHNTSEKNTTEIIHTMDHIKKALNAIDNYKLDLKLAKTSKDSIKDSLFSSFFETVSEKSQTHSVTKEPQNLQVPKILTISDNPANKKSDESGDSTANTSNLETLLNLVKQLEEQAEPLVEETVDATIYDEDYFKNEHDFHQNKKNQCSQTSGNSEETEELKIYKSNLFSFLRNSIFCTKDHLSWKELTKNLENFGFKGSPNKTGNGSVWIFRITQDNLLYSKDKRYKDATFNVHKVSNDSAPIPYGYLKYFQSGFSNIFGLNKSVIDDLQYQA